MSNINLLPWREERRKRRQQEFIVQGVLSFVGAAAVVLLINLGYGKLVSNQEQRNARIEQEISKLDEQIAEIQSLRDKREQLLGRMRVIQELQGNRPVIVRVFDEIARTLANGVYFRSLKMEGDVLTVSGSAEANNRVSALMRNLDGSAWFIDPNLKGIKENPGFGPQASDFELSFKRVNPRAPEGEEGAAGASAAGPRAGDSDREGQEG